MNGFTMAVVVKKAYFKGLTGAVKSGSLGETRSKLLMGDLEMSENTDVGGRPKVSYKKRLCILETLLE